MALIAWILVGAIAGGVASLLVGPRHIGCLTSVVVGMLGSLIGGAIVVLLETGTVDVTTAFTQLTLTSICISTLGAVVFLAILRIIRGR